MMGEDCWAPEPATQRADSSRHQVISSSGTRVRGAMGRVQAWLAARHESGLHSLACLHDAHAHYGEPMQGVGYRYWQARNYLIGWFHP